MAEFPLPDTDWEPTREFWSGAGRGELRLPRCNSCEVLCWYPEERCRACGHDAFEWESLSGKGQLFSWTIVHHPFVKPFREQVPYVTGLIALAEDPSVRLVTRIVDCEPDALEIDMPMQVVFRPLSFPDVEREVIAPMFSPARAGA